MRILVATGIYPPQIGGPATYSKLLFDELPKRGYDVEVANFGEFRSYPWGVRHIRYFFHLLDRASGADIIYAQDPVSVGVPALFAAQIRDTRFVLKIVGDYAWEQGRQRFGITHTLDQFSSTYHEYPWQVKLLKKIEKYVADGADAIITPSTYLKTIVSNWGVDPASITVIYNGIHLPVLSKTPSVLKRALSLKGSVIVTVGRLVPWKGIPAVIRALSHLSVRGQNATLVIVGDGPQREALESLVTELGLGASVRFTGELDRASALEYVKAADVFVLNTAYEGFSHQLIETMAVGTPIVTTSVGGNAELMRHEDNALIVPLDGVEEIATAIHRVLSDDVLATRLIKKAKKDASTFTDTAMLDALASFFSRHNTP